MIKIRKNIFDCKNCPNPCDGISKGSYLFKNDVEFSEFFENKIIDFYNDKKYFKAQKTAKAGFPDIFLENFKTKTEFYIEIKVQRRTFMSIQKYLPNSNLFPSETVALNQSDLERYFELRKAIDKNIYIMWILLNRPCIVKENSENFYIQDINNLQEIFNKEKEHRRFRRKSGVGDVVNGEHKGVVVNYHFSLNELNKVQIDI